MIAGLIRRCGLLAALLLAAHLAHAGIYGGYNYPSSGNCSPICDGVRATYVVPTPVYVGHTAENTDGAFFWVGINTGINTCSGSAGNGPLMQLGIASSITSTGTQFHRTWWEAAPCNNVQYTDAFAVSPGDVIFVELLCTSNCTTGDSTQVWQTTWTNITTSQTSQTTHTGFKVWMDRVAIGIEPWGDYPSNTVRPIDFTPVKFINPQVHQGGNWINLPNLGDAPAAKA